MPPTPPMGGGGDRSRPGGPGTIPGPCRLRRYGGWRAPVPGGPGTEVLEGAGPSGEAGRPCPGTGGTMPRSWGAPPTPWRPSARWEAPSRRGGAGHPSEAAGDRPSGRSRGAGTGRGAHLRRRGRPGGAPICGGGAVPGARPSEEDREARPSAGGAPPIGGGPPGAPVGRIMPGRAASCRWVDRLRSSGRGGRGRERATSDPRAPRAARQ